MLVTKGRKKTMKQLDSLLFQPIQAYSMLGIQLKQNERRTGLTPADASSAQQNWFPKVVTRNAEIACLPSCTGVLSILYD